jgi:hypothetical protein
MAAAQSKMAAASIEAIVVVADTPTTTRSPFHTALRQPSRATVDAPRISPDPKKPSIGCMSAVPDQTLDIELDKSTTPGGRIAIELSPITTAK